MSEQAAELRAEVEHWKAHAEEAGRGFARVCRDYARVSARNARLVEGIEAFCVALEAEDDYVRSWKCARQLRAALFTPTQPDSVPDRDEAAGGVGRG